MAKLYWRAFEKTSFNEMIERINRHIEYTGFKGIVAMNKENEVFGLQTGSVVIYAGLILAGTFAVLGTLLIQVLVQFGIVTAIGVLLDTFIVRPLLVPAITVVLGRFAFLQGRH